MNLFKRFTTWLLLSALVVGGFLSATSETTARTPAQRRLLLLGQPFRLQSVPGAYSLYDFNNVSTLFQDTSASTPVTTIGDSCRRVNDVFGSGRNLTAPSDAARPTWQVYSGALNGLLFDGSNDNLSAATAADWKFMHDGTGASVFLQFRTTDANPEARYYLITTSDDALANSGMSTLFRDDGANEDRLEALWFRANAGAAAVSGSSASSTLPSGTAQILAIKFERIGSTNFIVASVDGTEILNISSSQSVSSADPTRPLHLGALGALTANFLKGTISRVFICTGTTAYDQYRTQILAALAGSSL